MQLWKIDEKDIKNMSKWIKKFLYSFLIWNGSNNNAKQDYISLRGDKLEKRNLGEGKIIVKLLLIVINTDLQ